MTYLRHRPPSSPAAKYQHPHQPTVLPFHGHRRDARKLRCVVASVRRPFRARIAWAVWSSERPASVLDRREAHRRWRLAWATRYHWPWPSTSLSMRTLGKGIFWNYKIKSDVYTVGIMFYRGSDESRCQVRMTGDMMLSFPAGIVSVLANNPNPAKLGFRIKNIQNLDNLLPNKQLVSMWVFALFRAVKISWANPYYYISSLAETPSSQPPSAVCSNSTCLPSPRCCAANPSRIPPRPISTSTFSSTRCAPNKAPLRVPSSWSATGNASRPTPIWRSTTNTIAMRWRPRRRCWTWLSRCQSTATWRTSSRSRTLLGWASRIDSCGTLPTYRSIRTTTEWVRCALAWRCLMVRRRRRYWRHSSIARAQRCRALSLSWSALDIGCRWWNGVLCRVSVEFWLFTNKPCSTYIISPQQANTFAKLTASEMQLRQRRRALRRHRHTWRNGNEGKISHSTSRGSVVASVAKT